MINSGVNILLWNSLQNFKTNNLILDIIIGFIFITFFKYFSSNINFFNKFINLYNHFLNRNSIIVSFNCTETNTYWGLKMRGSDVFKAILYHIKQKISKNEVRNIKKIKEFILNNNDDDNNKNKNRNNFKEVLYIVDQSNEFQLIGKNELDIFFSISYIISKNEDTKNEDKIYTLNIKSKNINKVSLCQIQKYVERLINNYETIKNNELKNNLFVFQYEGFDDKNQIFKMYPFKTTCSIDKLYFEKKEKIINQILFFNNNKNWYLKRGKPYTLGICSYGSPGCGKTSFVKAIGKMLKRHLILVDLSKIKYQKNADEIFFNEKINNIKIPYNKRIYVFPDFDCMTDLVNKRKDNLIDNNELLNLVNDKKSLKNFISNNLDIHNPLNLSKLLNIFDGIPERTGQIIMMDTNHINNIDDALLRPGRIDCLIEFKKMSKENTIKMINNHYDCNLNKSEEQNIPNEKWTPAEIFMKCTQNKNVENLIKELV